MKVDAWGRHKAQLASALFGGMSFMAFVVPIAPDIAGEALRRVALIGWITLALALFSFGLGWFTEES